MGGFVEESLCGVTCHGNECLITGLNVGMSVGMSTFTLPTEGSDKTSHTQLTPPWVRGKKLIQTSPDTQYCSITQPQQTQRYDNTPTFLNDKNIRLTQPLNYRLPLTHNVARHAESRTNVPTAR